MKIHRRLYTVQAQVPPMLNLGSPANIVLCFWQILSCQEKPQHDEIAAILLGLCKGSKTWSEYYVRASGLKRWATHPTSSDMFVVGECEENDSFELPPCFRECWRSTWSNTIAQREPRWKNVKKPQGNGLVLFGSLQEPACSHPPKQVNFVETVAAQGPPRSMHLICLGDFCIINNG